MPLNPYLQPKPRAVRRKRPPPVSDGDSDSDVVFVKTLQGNPVQSDDDEEDTSREEMFRWRAMKQEAAEVNMPSANASGNETLNLVASTSPGQNDVAPREPDNNTKRKLPNFKRISRAERTPPADGQEDLPVDALDRVATNSEPQSPSPMAGHSVESSSAVVTDRPAPVMRTDRVIGDVGFVWASRVYRPPLGARELRDLKPKGGKPILDHE